MKLARNLQPCERDAFRLSELTYAKRGSPVSFVMSENMRGYEQEMDTNYTPDQISVSFVNLHQSIGTPVTMTIIRENEVFSHKSARCVNFLLRRVVRLPNK